MTATAPYNFCANSSLPKAPEKEALKLLLSMGNVQDTPPSGGSDEVYEKLMASVPTGKRKAAPAGEFPSSKKTKLETEVEKKLSEVVNSVEKMCKEKAKSSKASKTEKEKSTPGNWQCWSHEEEVFLVGAVLERFFARGSLSSTKRESTGSKNNCWESIKKTYDSCFRKYNARFGVHKHPDRTENALSRHYKVMKERSLGKGPGARSTVDLKALYNEWEQHYNKRLGLVEEIEKTIPTTKAGVYAENLRSAAESPDSLKYHIPSQARGRWNFSDEVILIGLVLETFFKRGSLSSSHKERKKNDTDFWQTLHVKYNKVKAEFSKSHGLNPSSHSRTAQALARHFKVMKVKLIESKGQMNLKVFYKEWEKIYKPYYNKVVLETTDGSTSRSSSPVTPTTGNLPISSHNQFSEANYFQVLAAQAQANANKDLFVNQNVLQQMKEAFSREMTKPIGGNSNSAQGSPKSMAGMNPAPPFPFQTASSFSSLMGNFPSSGMGVNVPGINGQDMFGKLPTPVTGLDMSKVKEMFNTFPSINTTPNSQATSTPQTVVSSVSTATPVVTTNGSSTTYWLPVTLHNVKNGVSSGKTTPTAN